VVDTTIVTDYGVHDLADETAAQIEAIERDRCESRPELLGRHLSISVTDEDGAGICIIPLDHA
jgi:hypothetical protein